jgi:transposase
LEARLAPEHLHRCKGDIVRQLLLTTLVTGAISAGLTASASAADTVEVGDPTGDAIIYRGDGTVEKNRRAAIDVRDTELRAGRYRTRLRVEMTDVRKRFFDRFHLDIEFTGDNGVSLSERWLVRRDGLSGIGTGGTGPYDCAFPKIRLSAAEDTLTYSMLNDCLDNPAAVKASLKVRYDVNEEEYATDRTGGTGMVSY